jgi:superfamily I DNA/RNA helicase
LTACSPARERKWSPYQRAIFDDVESGKGHSVVVARAGSGKSTTIVKSFDHVPTGTRTLMAAFNSSIAADLREAAREAKARVEVRTMHSFGFAALKSAFGSRLDDRKVPGMVRARFDGSELGPAVVRRQIERAASLAKAVNAKGATEVDFILDRAGVDVAPHLRPQVIAAALWVLEESKADPSVVSFDDMVWLPVVLGLRVPQFDRVFVDETQDFNRTMVELALMACAPGGRICAVGDDRQAIYGFRGADERAIPSLITRLDAKRLALSVCYRCAKSIVRLAAETVSDIEVAPGAEIGIVDKVGEGRMLEQARPGDFVLSRTNAPLIQLFFRFVSKSVPVKVAGRDVGARIADLVSRSRADTVDALTRRIEQWRRRERARLEAQDPPGDTDTVDDMAECVTILAAGARSIAEVDARIKDIFAEDAKSEDLLILSSTHKAKGAERQRVWLLEDTYRNKPSVEEDNLWYVAVTRAQRELYLVGGIGGRK